MLTVVIEGRSRVPKLLSYLLWSLPAGRSGKSALIYLEVQTELACFECLGLRLLTAERVESFEFLLMMLVF